MMVGDRAVETHLSAFIDCHSRYIVEARYYLRENLDILIDSLLRAWSLHGASRELYLDNAKIYHAHALRRACCALNIRLLHRGVGDPPPGGLIERFFRTAQDQLEAEVRAGPPLTLDRLNQALTAWLEVSYHERPNSETQQAPRLRYEQGRSFIRHVDLQQVLKYFLQRKRRRVDPTYSDVRLDGFFFRVDPQLRGDWVEVRYDPFAELETVYLYSLEDEYLGLGQRYQREGPATQPPPASPPGKPQYDYVQLLIQKHEESLAATQRRHRLPGGAGPRPTPLALRRIRQTTGGLSRSSRRSVGVPHRRTRNPAKSLHAADATGRRPRGTRLQPRPPADHSGNRVSVTATP